MASVKLAEMVDEVDDIIEGIEDNIDSIDIEIEELQSKYNSIRNEMLDVIVSDISSYLELTKKSSINGETVVLDPAFGETSINDFSILDSTGVVIYSLNINWDEDQVILDYIEKFEWGHDYLTKEIGEDGSYGIQPQIDQLTLAKTLLEADKLKLEQSKTIFGEF